MWGLQQEILKKTNEIKKDLLENIFSETEKDNKFIIPELADTEGYYTCPNEKCERK